MQGYCSEAKLCSAGQTRCDECVLSRCLVPSKDKRSGQSSSREVTKEQRRRAGPRRQGSSDIAACSPGASGEHAVFQPLSFARGAGVPGMRLRSQTRHPVEMSAGSLSTGGLTGKELTGWGWFPTSSRKGGAPLRKLHLALPPGWAGCGSRERVFVPRCAGLRVRRDLNTVSRLLHRQQGAIGKF